MWLKIVYPSIYLTKVLLLSTIWQRLPWKFQRMLHARMKHIVTRQAKSKQSSFIGTCLQPMQRPFVEVQPRWELRVWKVGQAWEACACSFLSDGFGWSCSLYSRISGSSFFGLSVAACPETWSCEMVEVPAEAPECRNTLPAYKELVVKDRADK